MFGGAPNLLTDVEPESRSQVCVAINEPTAVCMFNLFRRLEHWRARLAPPQAP